MSDEGSPRSPRLGKSSEDHSEAIPPGNLKISVHYAETGDSQLLYFPVSATVEELKRQVMEYAEHGVNSKMSSMILLSDDGTSLVRSSTLLSSLSSFTIFMFSKETLYKTYNPSVSFEDFKELELSPDPSDYDLKRELCERCLGRCRAQIDAGTVALRNLDEHAKSAAKSLSRFEDSTYTSYKSKTSILDTFENDMEKLAQVQLARSVNKIASVNAVEIRKATMLDALPKEKMRKWADEATRQNELIEAKMSDSFTLSKEINEGCKQVKVDWNTQRDSFLDTVKRLEAELHECSPDSVDSLVEGLKSLKAKTTKALFPTHLRAISSLQSRIKKFSDNLAGLKEALVVQEQKLSQIAVIRSVPDAYKAALKEADRRRQFATSYSKRLAQLTDFFAKERDRELERREQFQHDFGKILPPDLVPGLSPWVFPACEVTQRPIDPVLFANVLEYVDQATLDSFDPVARPSSQTDNTGELLFEADSGGLDKELSAMEILELQAENEHLKGILGGERAQAGTQMLTKLREQYENELERSRQRIVELETRLNSDGAATIGERVSPSPLAGGAAPSSASSFSGVVEGALTVTQTSPSESPALGLGFAADASPVHETAETIAATTIIEGVEKAGDAREDDLATTGSEEKSSSSPASASPVHRQLVQPGEPVGESDDAQDSPSPPSGQGEQDTTEEGETTMNVEFEEAIESEGKKEKDHIEDVE